MTGLGSEYPDRFLLQEVSQANLSGDDEGSLERTYTTLRGFWGKLEYTGGRETRLNRNVAAGGGSIRITVRPSDDYKKDYMVRRRSTLHPDKVMKITSIQPVDKFDAYLWCEDVEEEEL